MKFTKIESNQIDDFIDLLTLFNTVFDNEEDLPDKEHLQSVLQSKTFFAFAIKEENLIVGGLTLHILPNYYGKKPMAYIYDVGIAPSYQNKGYGKHLIQETFNYLQSNDFDLVFVQAEQEDTRAVSFYKKVNFIQETTAEQFVFSFK